jgi:hypothetical protein
VTVLIAASRRWPLTHVMCGPSVIAPLHPAAHRDWATPADSSLPETITHLAAKLAVMDGLVVAAKFRSRKKTYQ